MKNIKIFSFALVALFAVVVHAKFDLNSWEYKSKIEVLSQVGEYVSLDLPAGVFEKSKPDLGDLRIVNEEGEVPYALGTESEKDFYNVLPTKMFNLGTILGRETSFVVDMGSFGVLHSRVTIETPSENFKRGVEVYASDDQESWDLIAGKGQIFDFTNHNNGYLHARFTTVSYPESTRRYLRVVINDFGEAPINVTGASVTREVKEVAREVSYSPIFEIVENQKDETTDVIADLGSAGIPTSGGELKTSDDIFSRSIVITESADKINWSPVGNGYIFSIDTPKFVGTNLKFSYSESRKRFIKISVLNGDDRPIKFDGVSLSGVVRSVIFRHEQGKNYYLYLANSSALKPQYDIEKFSQYLNTNDLIKVSAGPIEKNESFTPSSRPFTERFPQALTVTLVLIVLLLLGLVVKLFTSSR
ncbi:MAG: DUF3999 family protein [bacterium]|nr:DUF3999 family protein [bacterium]